MSRGWEKHVPALSLQLESKLREIVRYGSIGLSTFISIVAGSWISFLRSGRSQVGRVVIWVSPGWGGVPHLIRCKWALFKGVSLESRVSLSEYKYLVIVYLLVSWDMCGLMHAFVEGVRWPYQATTTLLQCVFTSSLHIASCLSLYK